MSTIHNEAMKAFLEKIDSFESDVSYNRWRKATVLADKSQNEFIRITKSLVDSIIRMNASDRCVTCETASIRIISHITGDIRRAGMLLCTSHFINCDIN